MQNPGILCRDFQKKYVQIKDSNYCILSLKNFIISEVHVEG